MNSQKKNILGIINFVSIKLNIAVKYFTYKCSKNKFPHSKFSRTNSDLKMLLKHFNQLRLISFPEKNKLLSQKHFDFLPGKIRSTLWGYTNLYILINIYICSLTTKKFRQSFLISQNISTQWTPKLNSLVARIRERKLKLGLV